MKKVLSLALVSLLAIGLTSVSFANESSHGHGEVVVGYKHQLRDVQDDWGTLSQGVSNKYIKDNIGNRVGFWLYGERDNEVISEYKAYIGEGRASVLNGNGDYDDGGWVKAENWSKASRAWSSKGTNHSYYDYR